MRKIAKEKDRFLVKEGERVDDLLWNRLKLIQNPRWFCFGLDAVLLADFAQVFPGENVLDLCTGNGVIPLLLSAKESTASFLGVELLPEVVELAQRSVLLNGLSERIAIMVGDICCSGDFLSEQDFSVITVNPPYRKQGEGRISPSPYIAGAKVELYCDLAQIVAAIARHLVADGRFYMVYPYARLEELRQQLHLKNLQEQEICLVRNVSGEKPFLCLLRGSWAGKQGNIPVLTREFVVFREKGNYSAEMEKIFHRW